MDNKNDLLINIELKSNLKNLNTVVSTINNLLSKHTIILLNGDLASGKTTLASKLIQSFGIKEKVTSPTFSLSKEYDNGIFHYDIYNKELKEFISLGLLEQLDLPSLHIIEWADDKLVELIKDYGWHFITIDILTNSDNSRTYRLNNNA